jgi:hypothetical protein
MGCRSRIVDMRGSLRSVPKRFEHYSPGGLPLVSVCCRRPIRRAIAASWLGGRETGHTGEISGAGPSPSKLRGLGPRAKPESVRVMGIPLPSRRPLRSSVCIWKVPESVLPKARRAAAIEVFCRFRVAIRHPVAVQHRLIRDWLGNS